MIDQTSQFSAILTTVGLAKQAAADALGQRWKITDMAVGDANGTDPVPAASQTQLINEHRRAPLNQLSVDPEHPALILAEQILPENVGGWWVRELGLYDADGDLVAVANCAPSFKPLLTQGTGRTQVVRMLIAVSNTSHIELQFNPGVVLASHTYVNSKVREELDKRGAKQAVRVATTTDIALTDLQTIDDVALAAGDRVLVKHQTRAADNGLYIAGLGVWRRTADARSSVQVTAGLTVVVQEGSTHADTLWLLTTNAPIELGETELAFRNITDGLAPIASPAFIGEPTAPTAAAGSENEQLANTAFVQSAVTALIGSAPEGLRTLGALAKALADDPNFSATMVKALAGKQPNLGFTPVQQGTGAGQLSNAVKIGWNGADKVKVQIDASDFGAIALENWVATHFAHVSSFQRYMGENGYLMLPHGTILQWGAGMTDANGHATFSYPIAFPNAVVGFTSTARWFASNAPIHVGNGARNRVQATVMMNWNNTPIAAGYDWFAIGF
ncbi:hypothetical protein HDC30_000903 [Pseudomonas sp. JAI115]|uniref:phage tail protein n=1 Tax=Pseudomonas sp. JAI115 TaxID=2723061 RepID=UPI001607D491|nr:phage tail protein [Pseudomonas sp. JAI115]MBB6153709.1 hypothetical protein [Pseudomonas sp. JAI115]